MTEPEPTMVEVPETEREPAPVLGVDIPVEGSLMADGSPHPVPMTDLEASP